MKFSFSVLFFVLISSCGDRLPVDEKNIERYPWLFEFVRAVDHTDFSGEHNMDLADISFSFVTREKDSGSVIRQLDSVALVGKWKIKYLGKYRRFYTKEVSADPKDGGFVKILVSIDTTCQKVHFDVE